MFRVINYRLLDHQKELPNTKKSHPSPTFWSLNEYHLLSRINSTKVTITHNFEELIKKGLINYEEFEKEEATITRNLRNKGRSDN